MILWGALTASPSTLPLIGPDASRMGDTIAALEARLGHDRFEQLAAQGAGLRDDDAIALRSTIDPRRRGHVPTNAAADRLPVGAARGGARGFEAQ